MILYVLQYYSAIKMNVEEFHDYNLTNVINCNLQNNTEIAIHL